MGCLDTDWLKGISPAVLSEIVRELRAIFFFFFFMFLLFCLVFFFVVVFEKCNMSHRLDELENSKYSWKLLWLFFSWGNWLMVSTVCAETCLMTYLVLEESTRLGVELFCWWTVQAATKNYRMFSLQWIIDDSDIMNAADNARLFY